jgi:HlyD family secretion protein
MTSSRPGRPTRRIALALLAAACAVLSCGGDGGLVRGSGTIEMDEIDVSSLVSGRLERITVDEGDTVSPGDTLAVLDRSELVAELEAQTAEAARARAQLQDLQAGPRRQEIEAARAEVDAAAARATLAETEYRRVAELFERQVASKADLDRARSARDAALAERNARSERLREIQAGTRRRQLEAAGDAADAAHAQAAATRSRVRELVLVAPLGGVVLLRNYERGEYVPAGSPVVTLGNPDSLWLRVFVGAPLIDRVRLGAPAEVRVLDSKRGFEGRVVVVSPEAEFTPRAALTEEEQANLVFGVKIALGPTRGVLKAGLPAQAWITAPAATTP